MQRSLLFFPCGAVRIFLCVLCAGAHRVECGVPVAFTTLHMALVLVLVPSAAERLVVVVSDVRFMRRVA